MRTRFLFFLLAWLGLRPSPGFAQHAETFPLSANDLPLMLDLTGARQRVAFGEPVYARMWMVVTQRDNPKIRGEIIVTKASPLFMYRAVLSRHDYLHTSWEPADNNRVRLEIETPVPDELESFTVWTSNESLVFPPLRGARAGPVNINVRQPPELPLDVDHTILAVNEAVQDNDGLQIDTRRIEVKIRFSKNVLQTLLK